MNKLAFTFKSFSILDKQEKIGVAILLSISIINSLIQTLGLISIMPFIALIADPTIAESNQYIALIKEYFLIESHQSLLTLFAASTFIALLASNAIIVLNYWASLSFFNRIGSKLSNLLLKKHLDKSTQEFYTHKIADTSKKINSEVDRVIIGTQLSVMSLITDTITFSTIFLLLLFINVWVSIFTTFALVTVYYLVFKLLSKKVNELGKEFDELETSVYSTLRQALDMFREIRIAGKNSFFIKKFSQPNNSLYLNSTSYHVLKFLPIQLVELFAFAIILSVSTYVSVIQPNTMHAITTISIFAFAAYRLIPILNSIFDEIEEILYTSPVLQTLLSEFQQSDSIKNEQMTNKRTILKSNISIHHLSFSYDRSNTSVFEDFNLDIKLNQFTCISGRSGIGKSTLLDLLLGLIQPTSGSIMVDSNELESNNIRQWQNNIGYVPQHIQLLEGSIIENICFGVENNEVNLEQVKEVARIAGIHHHIENNLIDKYQTIIGNGGLSISGGEKQRIGIARSLYHNPQILILDEATNELDIKTEAEVVNSIANLNNKTIIFVTHKASIISMSDTVITLSENSITIENNKSTRTS
jgi:ATP-binding cassette, subfamily B, bacterial PglK